MTDMKPIMPHLVRSVQPRAAPSSLNLRPAPRCGLSIALVLLCCGLCCPPALAWNPYDTDSALVRDDARPRADSGSSGAPASPSYPARSDGATGWPGNRAGASGFGGAETLAPGFNDPWAMRVRPRFRFRGDAAEDGAGASDGGPGGLGDLRYRPLSERERERQATGADQPDYRPQDLQPRGPSWRLEDEGSAFGYHPDYQRFDAIAPPLPR